MTELDPPKSDEGKIDIQSFNKDSYILKSMLIYIKFGDVGFGSLVEYSSSKYKSLSLNLDTKHTKKMMWGWRDSQHPMVAHSHLYL